MTTKTKTRRRDAERNPPFCLRVPPATLARIRRAAAKTKRSVAAYLLFHAEAGADADLGPRAVAS